MPPPLEIVDWNVVARVGAVVAGGGPDVPAAERDQVKLDFRRFTEVSDDLVRSFTGLAPAAAVPPPLVLDRAGWIRANVDGFRSLVRPLAERITATVSVGGVARRVTAAAVGVQVGILLGYLSQKVLGQYDLVLASEAGGRVYYIGPNVIAAERRWNLDPREFRMWIALHEVTHRTQFTGVPWLRERVRSLIDRSIAAIELDPQRVRALVRRGRELLVGGPRAWRTADVMSLLMTPQQRAIIGEMQALMTVVEGHGTFVMNRIGSERLGTFEQMRSAVESRRSSASGAERAFQRAIGIEMKYEQYAIGERFMNEVAERAGLAAVNLVWKREENVPTLDEMRDPDGWLRRVGA